MKRLTEPTVTSAGVITVNAGGAHSGQLEEPELDAVGCFFGAVALAGQLAALGTAFNPNGGMAQVVDVPLREELREAEVDVETWCGRVFYETPAGWIAITPHFWCRRCGGNGYDRSRLPERVICSCVLRYAGKADSDLTSTMRLPRHEGESRAEMRARARREARAARKAGQRC